MLLQATTTTTTTPRGLVRQTIDALLAPISPKNLRLSAILIAIYQLLIAHVLLFMVLLGLAHAEQMKAMLALDIEDQKEYGFYDLPPFPNQMRLKTASQLISVTEVLLYILTTISSIYLISCISLFAGVFKNRSQLILPWLIVEFIFIVMATVIMFWCQNERFVDIIGGKAQYFSIGCAFIIFDSLIWYIIHSFYQSLRTMSKLTEIATVAIPCPPPGAIPFHFRRENMYLGSNGYKHILSDEAPESSY